MPGWASWGWRLGSSRLPHSLTPSFFLLSHEPLYLPLGRGWAELWALPSQGRTSLCYASWSSGDRYPVGVKVEERSRLARTEGAGMRRNREGSRMWVSSLSGGRGPPFESEMIWSLFSLMYASFPKQEACVEDRKRKRRKGSKWILKVNRCPSRGSWEFGMWRQDILEVSSEVFFPVHRVAHSCVIFSLDYLKLRESLTSIVKWSE